MTAWSLPFDPAALHRSGAGWRSLARAAEAVGADLAAAAQTLLAGWDCASARAYGAHRAALVDAFDALAATAGRIAGTVDVAAEVVRAAEHHIADTCQAAGSTPAAEAAVRDIRRRAEARLDTLADELVAHRAMLLPHAARAAALQGPHAAWLTGTDPAKPGQIMVDGERIVVSATGASDTITVTTDPHTGDVLVTLNGVVRRLPADADVVVRAGAGNDTITVTPGSPVRVTVLGGAGDDRISGGTGDDTILGHWGRDTILGGGGGDRVFGGSDADYVDGQSGDDLIAGGAGDDTLYGLAGRDVLGGGSGRDYLDGGTGADLIGGGADADVLIGGRAADTVVGGGGADRSFGEAQDRVAGVARPVTVELTDVGGFIQIEGSPDFVARVTSDLDALRASERGAAMLAALQDSHDASRSVLKDWPIIGDLFGRGNTLVIREMDAANGYARWTSPLIGPVRASIDYNPTFDDLAYSPPVPPIVVLYHELAHVYDGFYGTAAPGVYSGPDNPGVPNREREAVGLPIDADADPSTPDTLHPDHPFELTENGLREEFGLSPRLRY